MSGRTTPGELKVGGSPRVQLLPPSVKAREKARGTRRFMVVLVVLSLIVVGIATAGAYLNQRTAQQALDAANAQTSALLAQQAQYAEASRLAKLVKLTEQAEQTVTATEVQWLPLLVAIGPYIPSDAVWSGYAVLAPAPWEPALVPEGPLRVQRVAVVTVEINSANYFSGAQFVQNIPSIYGFADVKINGTKFDSGRYTTNITLTFDADALSGRYKSADSTTTTTTTTDEGTH